jgi:hypothetical protein
MVGPDLSASRSWDSGACTQPPADPPASATMGIDKDSTSRPPSFTFFFFFPHFSFLSLLGMLIAFFAISSSLLPQHGKIFHKLFTFYTLNLNCKSA